jgi:hypothetical protein
MAILNEFMVCFIEENVRKWVNNINKFYLSEYMCQKYLSIYKKLEDSSENLYKELEKFLRDKYYIMPYLKDLVRNL